MTGLYRRPIVAVAALVAGLALAAPATAANDLYGQQLHVSYKGLDLTSSSGREILNQRVERAINALCGVAPAISDQKEADEILACQTEARKAVASDISAAVAKASNTVATR